MCTNRHYVFNSYTRKRVLVNCGKCPACQQASANRRARRIKNHHKSGQLCLFVTLTYDKYSCPYVRRSDLVKLNSYLSDKTNDSSFTEIPVYRDCVKRYVRFGHSYDVHLKTSFETVCLDVNYFFDYEPFKLPSHSLNNQFDDDANDKIGVLHYADIQGFFARLRLNLKRFYNVVTPISYFACSEYGPTTFRPHFHVLIFCEPSAEEKLRHAIVKAWPYADSARTSGYIEVARDAASYVSSYVNRTSDFPSFLSTSCFRPKCSYSKGFGVNLDCFQLPSLLQKVKDNSLTYTCRSVIQGKPVNVVLPIPEYVISRYFPKCYGFSRLSDDTLAKCLLSPTNLLYAFDRLPPDKSVIDSFIVRLKHCFERYHAETGNNYFDYIIDYLAVWRCRFTTLMRLFYENNESTIYMYDNFVEFLLGYVRCDNLVRNDYIYLLDDYTYHYNNYPDIVKTTEHLTQLFYDKVKSKKLINSVMAYYGHNV